MALTDTQVRQLRAKLDARHVKTRKANGVELHYVEGWHVIAEANRIFGYDAWDRRTLATNCVSSSANGQLHLAAYTAKVRVTVRAGETTIIREGSGTGEGRAPTPGEAHELALKGAETDATKRALATFGNPFGLALYDREQLGVRKCRGVKEASNLGPWILRTASGSEQASFEKPSEFAAAVAHGDERSSRHRASIRHLGAERRDGARSQPLHETGSAAEIRHSAAAGRASQAMRDRSR